MAMVINSMFNGSMVVGSLVEPEVIKIKYDYKEGLFPVYSISEKKLKDSGMYFVGEGNFTFATAFAAIMGSWDNIIATTQADALYIDSYTEVQLLSICTIIENHEVRNDERLNSKHQMKNNISETDVLNFIRSVARLSSPTRWLYNVDGRKLTKEDIGSYNIWFQCPYTKELPELVQEFMKKCAEVMQVGSKLFIGICNGKPYSTKYALKQIFRFDDKHHCHLNEDLPFTQCYRFLGVDVNFVKKILALGYRHKGYNDIHKNIYHCHATLCFELISEFKKCNNE